MPCFGVWQRVFSVVVGADFFLIYFKSLFQLQAQVQSLQEECCIVRLDPRLWFMSSQKCLKYILFSFQVERVLRQNPTLFWLRRWLSFSK